MGREERGKVKDGEKMNESGRTSDPKSSDSGVLRFAGNREMFAKYKDFVGFLEATKAQHPLAGPRGYYPYGTIHIVSQIVPFADRHGIDLKACVEDKTVLDLGCGDGELSFFVELFQPKRIVAIDWSPCNYNNLEAFAVLRAALGSKVELLEADVHAVDFTQLPPFDVVFCLGFLYHSRHPLWVLENLSRLSKRLFLTTKVFDSEESYVYFYDVAECNNDATNWWCFSPKAITLMLKRTGLALVGMERLDHHVSNSHPVDLDRDGRIIACAVNARRI